MNGHLSTLLLVATVTHAAATPRVPPLRLYVLDCGTIQAASDSVFHPHDGHGRRRTLSDNCYLIVHPKGTLLWDTGLPDSLAKTPEGRAVGGNFTVKVPHPLAGQLPAIGYMPASITYLGISHMHSDHVGNAALFPHATLLIQRLEYDAAFGPTPAKFGSVVIKRTIGHTPGHQSLFVRLARTGNIVLSGDMAHFAAIWKSRSVPAFNFDSAQTVRSMQDMDRFLTANHATLWINHDAEQSRTLKYAPNYYE